MMRAADLGRFDLRALGNPTERSRLGLNFEFSFSKHAAAH
jgi:hypothetical protein